MYICIFLGHVLNVLSYFYVSGVNRFVPVVRLTLGISKEKKIENNIKKET